MRDDAVTEAQRTTPEEQTPPPVARMLREYRALVAEHGITWGDGPGV